MSLDSNKMKMQFSSAMCATDLEALYHGENPITIGLTVLIEILPLLCCSKQWHTKEIKCYYLLYLIKPILASSDSFCLITSQMFWLMQFVKLLVYLCCDRPKIFEWYDYYQSIRSLHGSPFWGEPRTCKNINGGIIERFNPFFSKTQTLTMSLPTLHIW